MKRKPENGASETVSSKKRVKVSSNISNVPEKAKKPPTEFEKSLKKTKKIKFEKPTEKRSTGKKPNSTEKTNSWVKKADKDGTKKFLPLVPDGEKPNWSEMKKVKKELKEKRRAKKLAAIYEPTARAKIIGEKLRRADCTPEKRKELSQELYELLKGNFNRAVFTHDASRVVQWLLKYCSPEIRQNVMTELKPSFVEMFASKYAKNCIKKALKHGTDDIRKEIIKSCYGSVVKLSSQAVSAALIDYAYENFATETNKSHFKQEFYGDMYKRAKDDKVKTISDVYADSGDMKSATLSAVKMNVGKILNKELFGSPVVQAVLLDYMKVCNAEDRAEMIVTLRSSIVELCQSENGAKLATICIWHGTTKDRKLSLKSMKGHVTSICNSEHGYSVLVAIFDCVDDTVLIKKLILSEIIVDLADIASNEHGRKVILYLVAHRDTAHFHPALIENLRKGDDNATSKKSSEARKNELVEPIIEPLVDSIAKDVNFWLSNSSIAMVTLAILKRAHGKNSEKAFEAIARLICDDKSRIKEQDGAERPAVEHSGLHMILKKLVLTDKTFSEKNCTSFGEVLEKELDEETIERWIKFNRGCFLLLSLIENSVESVVSSLKNKLKTVSRTLKTIKGPGASILLKKIK